MQLLLVVALGGSWSTFDAMLQYADARGVALAKQLRTTLVTAAVEAGRLGL